MKDNQPEFYSLSIDGKRLSFFVVMINGKVQSYFNACERCYPKKLGFSPDHGFMRCRACDAKYPFYKLKEGLGDCSPVRLKGTEKNGTYIITKESLLKGITFF